jgi:nitrous oxidase accessory protein
MRTVRRSLVAAALAGAGLLTAASPLFGQPVVHVSPDGPIGSIAEAIERVSPGGRVVIRAGTYREPTILVGKPVTIEGEPRGAAILDGGGERQIMVVQADDVTVRGLVFRNVGSSYVEDRAALRVQESARCTIEDNRFDEAFFGIYLARVTDCVVRRNVLRATKATETTSGNGVHLWTAEGVTIEDNRISGHRDGIYLEFAKGSQVRRNVSEGNLRYGLHFMYSDDCSYRGNTFRRNEAGVAVMYARRIAMIGNRFEENWGSASYGLLLKEIQDPEIVENRFARNSVGLLADGASRIRAEGNQFVDNGWAVQLQASTEGGRFTGNEFVGNTFDVSTNSRQTHGEFAGNYWDGYEGYDLDRDGFGDVPHRPVRLFSLLVAQNEPSLILLRSLFVRLLDTAERVFPVLTPETLMDSRPAMRRLR